MYYPEDLLAENDAHVQRFLSSNYFASENLVTDHTTSSLTWERIHAGYAPVGMLAFVNNAITSATRRSTMASCDTVVATLDDAVKAIASDSTPRFVRLEQEVAGEELLVDAEVLETLQPRTRERPHDFVALKHVTYRSAVDIGYGTTGEDYVVIETIGRDVDPDGFAFAFKMIRSVNVPGVFSHVDTHKPQRRNTLRDSLNVDCVTRRGYVHNFMLILSETKFTGLLRMQIWLDVDLPCTAGGVPIPLDSSFASLHDALSLGLRYRRQIERHFSGTIKKESTSTIAVYANVNLVPMTRMRVSHCQVCERKLGLFTRRRYSCDVCKASLCSTCAKTTDMCPWRLCACCYGRNHRLFSRQIVSKLASSAFGRLSFFARRSSTYSAYRQSVVSSVPTRKPNMPPMAATIKPFHASVDKDPRRTSSSGSSSSTTASSSSSSNPASSSSLFTSSSSNLASSSTISSAGFQSSSGELDQITELEDDHFEVESFAPVSYTDSLPLNGLKLLDETYLHRLSGTSANWQSVVEDLEVEEFLERVSMQNNEMPTTGRGSFQVL